MWKKTIDTDCTASSDLERAVVAYTLFYKTIL